MKKKYFIFYLLAIILSFSFLSQEGVVLEAKACPTGQYAAYDKKEGTFACTQMEKVSNLKEDAAKMSNGTALSNWAQKAGRLAITFSVAVSYATQAIAIAMIIYASYLYTTSDGDTRRLRQAKMIILYSFTGIFISSFALVISRLIGGVM